jgi:hypothetical protein
MRILTYAEAVARWVAAGRPTRSDAEIAEIHRVFCSPCGIYYRGNCRDCGCRVRAEGWAVLNKIAMATEHCARGKW